MDPTFRIILVRHIGKCVELSIMVLTQNPTWTQFTDDGEWKGEIIGGMFGKRSNRTGSRRRRNFVTKNLTVLHSCDDTVSWQTRQRQAPETGSTSYTPFAVQHYILEMVWKRKGEWMDIEFVPGDWSEPLSGRLLVGFLLSRLVLLLQLILVDFL